MNFSIMVALVMLACSSPASDYAFDASVVVDQSANRQATLILGQSNAVGQGYVTDVDPSLTETLPSVPQSSTFAYSLTPPLAWESYDGPLRPRRGTRFGAELSMGRGLPDHDVFECAVGATSLSENWNPDGVWPDAAENLYAHCVAFAHAAEATHNTSVTTVVWMQGEHDASDQDAALAYGDNLRRLAGRLLSDFPCARIVYYRLPRAETFADEVRAGQTAVSNDPWMTMVDVDALPRLGVHFTSDGYLTLGDMIAETISTQAARCAP